MSGYKVETSACNIDRNWNQDDFCGKGLGVEGEGKIVNLRFHTCTASDRVERFIAITLETSIAYKVVLDQYGVEKPLDAKDYATSPRVLKPDALNELVAVPKELQSAKSSEIYPAQERRIELWAGAQTDARKLELNDEIHFRTDKDSFIIKKFFHTKMGSFVGLEGGQVMAEMSQVANSTNIGKLEQDDMSGCDSDEWGDDD